MCMGLHRRSFHLHNYLCIWAQSSGCEYLHGKKLLYTVNPKQDPVLRSNPVAFIPIISRYLLKVKEPYSVDASSWGPVVLSRGHFCPLGTCGNVWTRSGCRDQRRCYWHLTGGGQGCCSNPTVHTAAATTKNYFVQNVSGAEKPDGVKY